MHTPFIYFMRKRYGALTILPVIPLKNAENKVTTSETISPLPHYQNLLELRINRQYTQQIQQTIQFL